MQITFAVPGTLVPGDGMPALKEVFGHSVYVHSFLGWGANAANARHIQLIAKSRKAGTTLIADPCMLKGDSKTFLCKEVAPGGAAMTVVEAASACRKAETESEKRKPGAVTIEGAGDFNTCRQQLMPLLNMLGSAGAKVGAEGKGKGEAGAACGRIAHSKVPTARGDPWDGDDSKRPSGLREGAPLQCMMGGVPRPPVDGMSFYGMSEFWYVVGGGGGGH